MHKYYCLSRCKLFYNPDSLLIGVVCNISHIRCPVTFDIHVPALANVVIYFMLLLAVLRALFRNCCINKWLRYKQIIRKGFDVKLSGDAHNSDFFVVVVDGTRQPKHLMNLIARLQK